MRVAGVMALLLAVAVAGCEKEGSPPPPVGPETREAPTPRAARSQPAAPASQPTPPAVPGVPWVDPTTDVSASWPKFRGPTGDGIAPASAKPVVKLDPARHTIWRTLLPASGFSSPILWGERVFLTSKGGRIHAFDRRTGKSLWDTPLAVPPPPPLGEGERPVEPGEAGLAAPTPCTDGQGVYAFFGDGVIGCVDFTGKQVWAKRLVVRPRNMYGLAGSPVLCKGLLIQQVDLDAEEDGDEEVFRSFIVALRAADGKEMWRKPRPVHGSWPTPLLVAEGERLSVITCADPWVIAYDPANGAERWRAKKLEGDVAASPVVSGTLLYAVAGPSGEVLAIRLGGSGDVTKSHIAWRFDEDVPDAASPLCDGKRYIQISDAGDVRALDARQGTPLWKKTLHGAFYASPVLAGGKAYLINTDGLLYVLNPADGEVVHKVELGAKVSASPAFVGPYIYLRTGKHLICFGPTE